MVKRQRVRRSSSRAVTALGAATAIWIGSNSLDPVRAFEFRSMRTPSTATSSTSSPVFSQRPLSAVVVVAKDQLFTEKQEQLLSVPQQPQQQASSWLQTTLLPVLSASLLITGNTVGAGCLVLPNLTAGPGLASSSVVFVAAYLMNLLSGLTIAQVAIHQQQLQQQQQTSSSGTTGSTSGDVPSSFQEFASANLCPEAGTFVSCISVFVNACVLSFDLGQVGVLGEQTWPGLSSVALSAAFCALMGGITATQSDRKLSNFASACVTVLFLAFGGLLLPCLSGATAAAATSSSLVLVDPLAAFLAPGTSSDWLGSISQAAPVILMSMVYQNIVPTITKLLNYDSGKTTAAISLGSFIPLVMYEMWCLLSGSGAVEQGNPLLTVFILSTLVGSTLGCTMSLTEEVQSFLPTTSSTTPTITETTNTHKKLPSVVASMSIPLVAALAMGGGDHLTGALQLAGSFGSPLLYGVLPALMAWNQQQKQQQQLPQGTTTSLEQVWMKQEQKQPQPLVSMPSLGVLGLLSTTFVGEELLHRVGDAMAFAT